jgi:hypothetical protein
MATNRANLFRNIRHSQVDAEDEHSSIPLLPDTSHQDAPTLHSKSHAPKRGRPATGKRSNPDWVGRTYYIKRKTDLDIEGELFQLKRQGIEMDKSELVDNLLSAWAECRKSGVSKFQISDILKTQRTT